MNEELAQELHKLVIENSKKGKPILTVKIIFGQQIYMNWGHFLLRIEALKFYCL